MPVYTYRREDGTTFDYRQKFSDEPLKVDPESGQRVVRVVQAAGVIFKGSGFYVTDSKSASKASVTGTSKNSAEGGDKSAADIAKEAPAKETPAASTASAAAD